MGNQAVQKQIVAQVLDESTKLKNLNKTESPWHETNLIGTKSEGPIVAKQLLKIKSDSAFESLKAQMEHIYKSVDSERKHPNVMNYYKQSPVLLSKDEVVLLRQYICYNLSEKLVHIPTLLPPIEKQWLIFQLLCGLKQIHSVNGLVHGDIKPDNILITSYNWLYIVDLLPYKPVMIMDDDLKTYNMYFGDLENNIRCYLAPERWLTKPEKAEDYKQALAPSMDVFSAGCVIAEILSDGIPLFDLPRLQNYRRSQYNLREELSKRIEDEKLVQLLLKMLARDPEERPTAADCLSEWCEKVFPSSFYDVFFHIGAAFQRVSNLYTDNKIALIHAHVDSISASCFGTENALLDHSYSQMVNPELFRLIQDEQTIGNFGDLEPKEFSFKEADYLCNKENYPKRLKPSQRAELKESALIVIQWIGQLLPSSFQSQTRLAAIEIIAKLAKKLPFEMRLGQVLPYLAKVFEITVPEQSKVSVLALETLLDLFDDLHNLENDFEEIEPFDFKVFQNYILPIFKKLMDQSKDDPHLRYSLARNLAKIASLGTRLLEVAQASSIELRKRLRDKRNSAIDSNKNVNNQNNNLRDQVDLSIVDASEFAQAANPSATSGSSNGGFQMLTTSMLATRQQKRTMMRTRMVSEHEGAMIGVSQAAQQFGGQNDAILEDIVCPNFDAELGALWLEIQQFIESFSGEEHDSNSLIAMLESLSDLSKIFGAEQADYLISQCISSINKPEYRVKIQVLKTLQSLCLRVGQKKVEDNVLPLTELVLNDPEDLVVAQNIKMLNQFLCLRLITKHQSLKVLESLLPFLLHPNKQIRLLVASFVNLLHKTEERSQTEVERNYYAQNRINIKKEPLFSLEEFYCFVRPKLLIYALDKNDEMLDIDSAQSVLAKLRPPLSLKVMRQYFREVSDIDNNSQEAFQKRESEFAKEHPMNDDDTFAFAFLCGHFKERTRKMRTRLYMPPPPMSDQRYERQIQIPKQQFDLQREPIGKVYRVVKACTIGHLAKIDQFSPIKSQQSFMNKMGKVLLSQKNAISDEQKVENVRKYQENLINLVEPMRKITENQIQKTNFGLNTNTTTGDANQKINVRQNQPEEVKENLDLLQKNFQKTKGMVSEMDRILAALNFVPSSQTTDSLHNMHTSNSNVTGVVEGIIVGNDLQLTQQGAQPSLLPHFEHQQARQSLRVNVDHEREFRMHKQSNQRQIRPKGTLITTLYEHQNPVNSVCVSDDQQNFFTASREDRSVHMWSVQKILEDVTAKPLLTISEPRNHINQICTISRTNLLAMAGSTGLQICDLDREQQSHQASKSSQSNDNTLEEIQNMGAHQYSKKQEESQRNLIDLGEDQDEVTRILNLQLPTNNSSSLIAGATQKGLFFMHDLRQKRNILKEKDQFGYQKGAVTSMIHGTEPFQLILGTLGGYVMVYDIRYNVQSSIYRQNLNHPILAMQSYQKTDVYPSPLVMVSTGGLQHELSSLNLETGIVETFFKLSGSDQKSKSSSVHQQQPSGFQGQLNLADMPLIPSFVRENSLRGAKFGTVLRDTTLRSYDRYLHSLRSEVNFSRLNSSYQCGLFQNKDQQLFDVSRQRFSLIHESCKSVNACRSIVIPRDTNHLHKFSQSSANYAITGSNDSKLRFWNLLEPTKQSFTINSPNDAELNYTSERIQRETVLIEERQSQVKEFPGITAKRLQDSTSAQQYQYINVKNRSTQVKYAENTAYHNTMAQVVNNQIALETSKKSNRNSQNHYNNYNTQGERGGAGNDSQADIAERIMKRFQHEKEGNSLVLKHMNGLSEGQYLNNLGIQANWEAQGSGGTDSSPSNLSLQSNSLMGGVSVGGVNSTLPNSVDIINERQMRDASLVSHTDAILDLALIDFARVQGAHHPNMPSNNSSLLQQRTGSSNTNAGMGMGQDLMMSNNGGGGLPILVSCSRDCTVKLWKC